MKCKKFWLPVITGLICLGSATRVLADEALLRTITVTGLGQESIATSLSQVRLGVEVRGETADEVQEKMTSRTTQVVNYLQNKQVTQLTTTGIYLQPQYDYSDGGSRLVGYVATNTVSFEVPTELAGGIMDGAVKSGATRIDGLTFRATDEAIAAAENIALGEASQDAKTQAEVVLESLGLTSQGIVQIQINGSNQYNPYLYNQQSATRSSVAADTSFAPVQGGEQTVNASVTLTIRY